jgi:CRP-like cAMP-binding protein
VPTLFSEPAAAVLKALPAATRAALEREAPVRALRAGEALLDVGDEVATAGLVVSGVLREVYVDVRGAERTRGFSFEGDFVGSWADVLARRASRTRVEALRPAKVRCFPVARLLQPSPGLDVVLRLVAERLYVRKSDREYELLTMSAAERYEALLAQVPDLEALVQLQHVASYLGITPVHLSRLRRRRREAAGR